MAAQGGSMLPATKTEEHQLHPESTAPGEDARDGIQRCRAWPCQLQNGSTAVTLTLSNKPTTKESEAPENQIYMHIQFPIPSPTGYVLSKFLHVA